VNPVSGFGPWNVQPGGGTEAVHEIASAGLVSLDASGNVEPRLAMKLPSLSDGTMEILPDGRMQATWKLRPGVTWQDGAPFTADDVVFGWEVSTHPAVPVSGISAPVTILKQIDRVYAVDDSTVVVMWRTPFFLANELFVRTLWPLPRRLLSAGFQGDKSEFINLPYWTNEYVHLGPFRLVDFGLGETLVFERFDAYFLGKPRLERITVKVIPDPNTLFANLQAGSIDVAGANTLTFELAMSLRDDWQRTGGGTVVQARADGFRAIFAQMHAEWAQPVEVSRDVRVRRGMYLATDRTAISEVMLPGALDTRADSFLDDSDPRAAVVGKPFARYAYDPQRALQEFVQVGWQRDRDGRLLNQAGEQVTFKFTFGAAAENVKRGALIAQLWRDFGIQVQEEAQRGALANDSEYRAKFPAFVESQVSTGPDTLARWDSRIAPTPERRYTGNNQGSYINPEFDRVLDRLRSTLDEREQALLLAQGGEILANDLPVMPLYYTVRVGAVRSKVQALLDGVGKDVSETTRNVHLWHREL
jgi:peptide/nickel transport system substrate-binding protein